MRPEFFSDGIIGPDFLKRQNKLPTPNNLEQTHVLLGTVKETYLDDIWTMMQAESWSPNGEARALLTALGLKHTSMSVGDIVEVGGRVFMVDGIGFHELTE